MPTISQSDYHKLKNRYRHDLARHLAKVASNRKLITYGDLAGIFGGTARGWGDVLSGIAIRCHEAKLPLLPVIVVNAESRLPSIDALIYRDFGLNNDDAVIAEQQRCFALDWQSTPLGT